MMTEMVVGVWHMFHWIKSKSSQPADLGSPDVTVPEMKQIELVHLACQKYTLMEKEQLGIDLLVVDLAICCWFLCHLCYGQYQCETECDEFHKFVSWKWIMLLELCHEYDHSMWYGDRGTEMPYLGCHGMICQHVIYSSYTVEELHIIILTCHLAMVMEWDYVQVCDDFVDLCCFKCTKRTKMLVITNAS